MVAKRALVVDDSRSARTFLAKLLEEQQFEVDSAETAEQAIEYLTKNSPDVIFMDHLMPGMDGFQAVQAIKANPRTAMIPIYMYTSQEGELYLGQARALGAAGVVSKSAAPTDVRAVLLQLPVVAQPRPVETQPQTVVPPETPVTAAADTDSVRTATLSVLTAPPVDELLKDEVAALRRHLAESLDAHGRQMLSEVRTLLREMRPATSEAPLVESPPPRQSVVPWVVALAASVAVAVLGTLLWQGRQQLDALLTELMDTKSTVALLTARLGPAPPIAAGTDPAAATIDPALLVVPVPFGEVFLDGARIPALRDFVARIATLNEKGTVEVRRHAGRFCLASSGADKYALADAATPYIKCELVADATDPVLGSAAAESLAFAAAVAELRKQHAAMLVIDVGVARDEAAGVAYPEVSGEPPRVPTAGEWNAAAQSNNRVEIRWHPAK